MSSVTRDGIFEQAAHKLRQDFEELQSIPHAASKGKEAEGLLASFLSAHLPKRFEVGSGFIIDPADQVSKQQDIVIYDALNCPIYRASDDAGIFPSDNVASVVEVKSTLTRDELRDCFEKISNVKSLKKTRLPEDSIGPRLTLTMGCVFAYSSKIKLETIQSEFCKLTREFSLGRHPDIVVVLDRGALGLVTRLHNGTSWTPMLAMEGLGGPQTEGNHLGVGCYEMGEYSLDYFLRVILGQLNLFRWITPHPGFALGKGDSSAKGRVEYLTSITHEKDPDRREAKLKKYREEVVAEFERTPDHEEANE